MDGEQPALDARQRSELIEALLEKLRERYIYPDVATAMEEAIRRRVGSGEYDAITEGKQFCGDGRCSHELRDAYQRADHRSP
jgi:hypothetical protein